MHLFSLFLSRVTHTNFCQTLVPGIGTKVLSRFRLHFFSVIQESIVLIQTRLVEDSGINHQASMLTLMYNAC